MKPKQSFTERYTHEQREAGAKRLASSILEQAARAGFTVQLDQDELAEQVFRNAQDAHFAFHVYFRTESNVWGSEASVSLALKHDPYGKNGLEAKAEITWSSTQRSIAQATHALKNYRNAIDLAAYLEAALN